MITGITALANEEHEMTRPIDFAEKLAKLSDLWSPRVVAEINDYQFKVVW